MNKETKENCYRGAYQIMKQDAEIKNLDYPRDASARNNYIFTFEVGKAKAKFLLTAGDTDRLELTATIVYPGASDDRLTMIGTELTADSRYRFSSYDEKVNIILWIPLNDVADAVAGNKVMTEFAYFVNFLKGKFLEGHEVKEEEQAETVVVLNSDTRDVNVPDQVPETTTKEEAIPEEKPVIKENPFKKYAEDHFTVNSFDESKDEAILNIDKKIVRLTKFNNTSYSISCVFNGEDENQIKKAKKKEYVISNIDGISQVQSQIEIRDLSELADKVKTFVKNIYEIETNQEEEPVFPETNGGISSPTGEIMEDLIQAYDDQNNKPEEPQEPQVMDLEDKNEEVLPEETKAAPVMKDNQKEKAEEFSLADRTPDFANAPKDQVEKYKSLYDEITAILDERKKEIEYKEKTLDRREDKVARDRQKNIEKADAIAKEREELKEQQAKYEKDSADLDDKWQKCADKETALFKKEESLKQYEEALNQRESGLNQREEELDHYKAELNQKSDVCDARKIELDQYAGNLEKRSEGLDAREQELNDIEKAVDEDMKEVELERNRLKIQSETLDRKRKNIDDRASIVEEMEMTKKDQEELFLLREKEKAFQKDLEKGKKDVQNLSAQLKNAKDELQKMEKENVAQMNDYLSEIEESEKEIDKFKSQLAEANRLKEDETRRSGELETSIQKLQEEIDRKEQEEKKKEINLGTLKERLNRFSFKEERNDKYGTVYTCKEGLIDGMISPDGKFFRIRKFTHRPNIKRLLMKLNDVNVATTHSSYKYDNSYLICDSPIIDGWQEDFQSIWLSIGDIG